MAGSALGILFLQDLRRRRGKGFLSLAVLERKPQGGNSVGNRNLRGWRHPIEVRIDLGRRLIRSGRRCGMRECLRRGWGAARLRHRVDGSSR